MGLTAKRTVIIGLDGMPHRLIKDLSENGTMPNVKALIKEGVFRQMESSIPEVSSVAWSSIITGKNPGEHGIFGFTDLAPGTYRTVYPNFSTLKTASFWERKSTGRSVIINVPSTYPARELNGVLIAGFVALDLEKATYPRSLVPRLQKMDYRVDVDSQKAHQSLGFFLRDLDRTFQARISAYRYLWNKETWDTFMLVFTGTDRLAHFLWDAYEDEGHKHRLAFMDHFRQIDKVVGEIVQQLTEKDTVILLSDHGFESLEKDIYVSFFLRQRGYLKFKDDDAHNLKAIAQGTRAFALDPARIYLNLKGKYPQGSVEPQDRNAVLDDLENAFRALEIEGKKVIKRVYRKEELYEGPQAYRAPDLVLLANEGFNLRANVRAKQLWGKGVFMGKHSQNDAFLLVRDDSAPEIVPETPCVSDVISIMDKSRNRRV